jgi:hypothetical protein
MGGTLSQQLEDPKSDAFEVQLLTLRLHDTLYVPAYLASVYDLLPAYEGTIIGNTCNAEPVSKADHKPEISDDLLFRVFAPNHSKPRTIVDIEHIVNQHLKTDISLNTIESSIKMKERFILKLIVAHTRLRMSSDVESSKCNDTHLMNLEITNLDAFYERIFHHTKGQGLTTEPISTTDILLAMSITMSTSLLSGLRGTPMFSVSFKSISMNLVSMLSTLIPQLTPFPVRGATVPKRLFQIIRKWANDTLSLSSSIKLSDDKTCAHIESQSQTSPFFIQPLSAWFSLSFMIASRNDVDMNVGKNLISF